MSDPRIKGPLENQIYQMLERVRRELDKRGITMNRWSVAAGMDRNYVRKILKHRRPILIDTVDRLIDAAWMISGYDVKARVVLTIHDNTINLEEA